MFPQIKSLVTMLNKQLIKKMMICFIQTGALFVDNRKIRQNPLVDYRAKKDRKNNKFFFTKKKPTNLSCKLCKDQLIN